MKTYRLDIHRHFYYDYEVKASSKEEAETKAWNDCLGKTKDVQLLEKGCYDQDCFECVEVSE